MKNLLLFTLLVSNIILGQSFVPNAPELNLKGYILIDPTTNTIIAESNSDGFIEPASMTKVMTAYVVADQIENDLISIDSCTKTITTATPSIMGRSAFTNHL